MGVGQPLPIGVAVSGGADSVFLLYWMLERHQKLTVLHVNHKLRGAESDADAAFVGELAARLNLPFELHEIDAKVLAGNLEQAARNARYAYFRQRIASGLDRVALGHTRSDQAETVLFRFLRGAGTAGLAAIRPETSDGFIRPLLAFTRAEVVAWLRERQIVWREDSSNANVGFARNRIRHVLLPQLVRDWNPALPEILAQTADLAQMEEDYWAGEIERIAAKLLRRRPPAVILKSSDLCVLHPAVARRLVRRAVEIAKGDLRSVDYCHVERIRSLSGAAMGHGRVQIPGLDVCRSFDWLRIGPAMGRSPEFEYAISVPGRIAVSDRRSVIDLRLEDAESIYNEAVNCLDWGQCCAATRWSSPLVLRNWRAGDRFRPVGRAGETKLKRLFQEARIAVWERRGWPVIAFADRVVWARQFGPAAEFAASANGGRVLVIRESAPVEA